MLSGLEDKGRNAGEAARRRAIDQLAARITEAAPDRHPVVDTDGITLTGRGVIGDPPDSALVARMMETFPDG